MCWSLTPGPLDSSVSPVHLCSPMIPVWYLLGDLKYQLNLMKRRGIQGRQKSAKAKWAERASFCHPQCQFLPGPPFREGQAAGSRGPFQQSSVHPPLSLVPPDGGARKKDHQEAWARRCLFIGAGAVLEGVRPWEPHWDLHSLLLPPAGDTLSQGHLFHQFLQKEREDDDPGSLELRHKLDRLPEHRVRGEAGGRLYL